MGHLTNPGGFRYGRSQFTDAMYASAFYRERARMVFLAKGYVRSFFRPRRRFSRKKGFLLSHVKIIGEQNGLIIRAFFYNAESVVFQKKLFFTQFMRSMDQFASIPEASPKFGFLVPRRNSLYNTQYALVGKRNSARDRMKRTKLLVAYEFNTRRSRRVNG